MTDTTESEYYAFMRFDPANARKVLGFYTRYFEKGPVLELACGPGVFLDLLREKGLEAAGVDIDEGMARIAGEAGHDVVVDDAVSHLKSKADASVNGLFTAHFLEHLPSDGVQAVYREAFRVLQPGGVFVAVVPNAACLSVLGYDFWRDPTHVRFYDPVVLQFFAYRAGLAVTAHGENPNNHPGPPPYLQPNASPAQGSLASQVVSLVQHAESAAAARNHEQLTASEVRWRSVAAAIDAARAEAAERSQRSMADQARLWSELGNVISALDDRVQTLQHELSTVRTAYLQLLAQLYPANEVFVVAQRPEDGAAAQCIGDLPPVEGAV